MGLLLKYARWFNLRSISFHTEQSESVTSGRALLYLPIMKAPLRNVYRVTQTLVVFTKGPRFWSRSRVSVLSLAGKVIGDLRALLMFDFSYACQPVLSTYL